MTDEELLEEWYRARGPRASPVPADLEAVIVRNLRARYDQMGCSNGNRQEYGRA